MRKTIDMIFENRVILSKQASKQTNKQTNKQMYYAKKERRLRLFTRVSYFIRMCKKRGDWYYLVSSPRDVYA